MLRHLVRLSGASVSKRHRGRPGNRGTDDRWVTKILEKMEPSCPTSLPHPPSCPRSLCLQLTTTRPSELTYRLFPWEGRGVLDEACLAGPRGEAVLEGPLEPEPPACYLQGEFTITGLPACLLGDAQYMCRCKSGQSEDFIYII